MDLSKTHIELVEKVYETLEDNIAKLRLRKSDSLTLSEKILYGHARDVNEVSLNRAEDFGDFLPDRVAMQDATAQMALLQFILEINCLLVIILKVIKFSIIRYFYFFLLY